MYYHISLFNKINIGNKKIILQSNVPQLTCTNDVKEKGGSLNLEIDFKFLKEMPLNVFCNFI